VSRGRYGAAAENTKRQKMSTFTSVAKLRAKIGMFGSTRNSITSSETQSKSEIHFGEDVLSLAVLEMYMYTKEMVARNRLTGSLFDLSERLFNRLIAFGDCATSLCQSSIK
jgi:hypothetical protein